MNTQFTKSFNAFEEAGFKPVAVSILNHLYDYGDLSMKNGWIKNGIVFVKYLRSTLAEQINVSVDTITRALKDIEAQGWLKVQHVKNAANTYFLTKYNDLKSGITKQNASTGNAKCNTNHTNFNQTNNTNETSVTEKGQNDLNQNDESSKTPRQLEIINKKDSPITISDYDLRTKLYRSLQYKVHMKWDLIYTIDKFTNGYDDMRNKVGIIFKAKKAAKDRLIKLGYEEASYCLSFEDNLELSEKIRGTFFDAMTSIISGHVAGKKIKNANAFLTSSLYKCFDDIVDDETMQIDSSKRINGVNRNFEIPIIKLDK